MDILICTDLEGIWGVEDNEIMKRDNMRHQDIRRYLMEDINAAIDGVLAAGAKSVTVLDGHRGGGNFIKDMLDERAFEIPSHIISSKPYEEICFDAVLLIGAHAMAGTEKAFLDHTQSSESWFEYKVNGVPGGEISQIAYWMGAKDIPLVMVSGDRAACKEAEELVGGIYTACVKEAFERNLACSIQRKEALKRIYTAAKKGIENRKNIKAVKIKMPATIEVTFTKNEYCDDIVRSASNIERSGRTLIKRLDKINSYMDIVTF